MDGVLLDSRGVVERVWRAWERRRGRSADPMLAIAHGRRIMDTLRLTAPEFATAEEVAWLDDLERRDVEGILPVPGAAALLASLPRGSWTLVTSASRDLAGRRLGAVGLALPERAVTAEDVAKGKPAPDGYLLGAQRLGVPPERCLVVEDAPAGIAAGKAAGARVLAVTTTHAAGQISGADYIVPTFTDVTITIG